MSFRLLLYFLTCIPCAEDFSAATKWDVLLGDTSPRSTWRHWSLLGTGETVQLDCRIWAVLGSKSGRVSDCFNSSFLHSLACSTLKKTSKDFTTTLQRPNFLTNSHKKLHVLVCLIKKNYNLFIIETVNKKDCSPVWLFDQILEQVLRETELLLESAMFCRLPHS